MRPPRLFVFAVAMLGTSAATAAPMIVEGEVTAVSSRWTEGFDRIVTEAVVHTPTGDVVVSQLGGTIDGLTMRQFPGPDVLVPGMRVAVGAHPAPDLADRMHVIVDDVRVLAYPAGFVRTGPTKGGNSLYWESGCVFVTVDSEGTKQIPDDTEIDLVDQAISTWNTAIDACSYLRIVNQGTAEKEVGRDMVNVIKFRDASWCRPAIKDDPARCYADSAAGITTAVYVDDPSSDRDGAIVDADIELNGKNFAISNMGQSLGAASCQAELLNTLTHELGHLLGLEHPCLTAGDPPRVDGQGRAVPQCSSTSDPIIIDATMYNFQDCGETKKATLEGDDISAICGIYPSSADPGECEPVTTDDGWCSASDSASFPFAPALVLAGVGALVLRRPRKLRPRR